ncbi:MAG: preprotein translocase subunit SecE [Armatimonadetes bacterium]|nr:preprotein translocase subunit SecE [Armatimonadota bacterium]
MEDAYDDADLDDADVDDADLDDDPAQAVELDDDEAAPARRARGGAATRERTVSRDRTKKDASAKPGIFARLARRFRETVAELQKVIWPTRRELLTYTTVVIVFVSLVMGFVAGLDLGFARLMFLIFGTPSE